MTLKKLDMQYHLHRLQNQTVIDCDLLPVDSCAVCHQGCMHVGCLVTCLNSCTGALLLDKAKEQFSPWACTSHRIRVLVQSTREF